MARVRVKRVPSQEPKINKRELFALLCYYYPQYTLKEASLLPYRDINLLIRIAKEQRASEYYTLTQISAAPHSKKGQGVKKLSEYFKKLSGKTK